MKRWVAWNSGERVSAGVPEIESEASVPGPSFQASGVQCPPRPSWSSPLRRTNTHTRRTSNPLYETPIGQKGHPNFIGQGAVLLPESVRGGVAGTCRPSGRRKPPSQRSRSAKMRSEVKPEMCPGRMEASTIQTGNGSERKRRRWLERVNHRTGRRTICPTLASAAKTSTYAQALRCHTEASIDSNRKSAPTWPSVSALAAPKVHPRAWRPSPRASHASRARGVARGGGARARAQGGRCACSPGGGGERGEDGGKA